MDGKYIFTIRQLYATFNHQSSHSVVWNWSNEKVQTQMQHLLSSLQGRQH